MLSAPQVGYRRAIVSCALLAGAMIGVLIQLFSRNALGPFSNWFVPDGISLAESFNDYWSGEQPSYSYLGSSALNFIYVPVNWIGVLGFALINGCVLAFTARAFVERFKIRVPLLLFPYFAVAVALPSKDILVMAMAVMLVNYMFRANVLATLLVSVATFFVRDGAFVIAMGFLLSWYAISRMHIRARWVAVAVIALPLLIGSLMKDLAGDLFIYSRLAATFENSVESSRVQFYEEGGAALRLIGNVTNLAMRPSILDDEGGVALIGAAYWISGISMLYAAMAALAFVWRADDRLCTIVGMLFFVAVSVVTMSPWVQPRYVLPYAALVVIVHVRRPVGFSPAQGYFVAAGAALLGMIMYSLTPIGLPGATSVDLWSPFWTF